MTQLSRRRLLQGLAGASASSLILPAWAAKPKKKIGVALLGLGGYSRDLLAPGLQLTEHCELRGIVTGSPEKIPEWQKKYGIKDKNVYTYDTLAKIADNPDIDVVYVVTPTFLHKKFAVIAADAGKHVWCEKPMAMTVDECQAIIDACNKNKVKLSIGYRLQHEPNTRTVIEFAKSKPYGAIKTVKAEAGYAGRGGPQDDWRMDQSKGGGAIYDMGVYPINAARYASGLEPIAVTGRFENDYPEIFTKTDSTAIFDLEFPGGVIAHCATSVTRNFNQLRVDCEKGWYELQPMQAYNGVQGRTSDGKALDKKIVHQQAKQMDDDALAILNNTDVMVPGIEGLKDIRIVQAVLQSGATGKRVELG
jgi:glucose-fructose oxidoreductase